MWLDCERKWYYSYPLGFKSPPKKSQQRGTAVHKHVEEYLKAGIVPPDTREGRMARSAFEHLPSPGTPGLLIEHGIMLPTASDLPPWKGFMDLVVPPIDVARVIDLKTTSDFVWAKKPRELLESPQMISYGKFTIDEYRVDEVGLMHLYILDSPSPVSKPVRAPTIVKRDFIEEKWEVNVDRVRQMVRLELAKPSADDVKPNPAMCPAYGGCEHRERCKLPKRSFPMSLDPLANILNTATRVTPPPMPVPGAAPAATSAPVQAAVAPPLPPMPVPGASPAPASAPAPVTAAVTPPPMPVAAPAPAAAPAVPAGFFLPPGFELVSGYSEPAMRSIGGGTVMVLPKIPAPAAVAPPPPAPTAASAPPMPIEVAPRPQPAPAPVIPEGYYVPDGYVPATPADDGRPRMANPAGKLFFMPSESERPKTAQVAPPPVQTSAQVAPPPVQTSAQVAPPPVQTSAPAVEVPVQTSAPVVEPQPEMSATVTTEITTEKRGRGRPPKEKAPLSKETTEAFVDIIKDYIAAALPAAAAATVSILGLELWIDINVTVTRGAPLTITPVEEWMRPALEVAAKNANVPDWRVLDFNKGKGYLFAALAALPPPTGIVTMRSSMLGAEIVLEVLTPYARLVKVGGGK